MKKTIAIALTLILALGCAQVAFASGEFTDVAEDAYYADAVAWAVDKAVTDGMGDGAFAPDSTVTRAQAVTFLWRMAGKPAPTQTEIFADVEADANNWWYKEAVQWAFENGITNGTGEGFSPYVTCSRGMILTMLYRLEGKPWDAAMTAVLPENEEDFTLEDLGNALIQSIVNGIRTENALPDVEEGEYYELPVIWAMFSGILGENQVDMETRLVQPAADCPRGEMVYFLYQDSGDAPAPQAAVSVETGTIEETVALEKDKVKITITGIESDDDGAPQLTCTIVNGSDKLLFVGTDEFYVNSYMAWPQVYIPVESSDGWTFYGDVAAAPGETVDFYISLSSLEDMFIDAIRELEFRFTLTEVEPDEDGYYSYVDDFADSDTLYIRTSLYDAAVSYDMEGAVLFEKNGLKVLAVQLENDVFNGPQIAVYACNGGSEAAAFELEELKLDGKVYETFFTMNIPAGRRSVEGVYITFDDETVPFAREAEFTFRLVDTETWDTRETLDPVTLAFENA